jgi:hypothetical protein
MAKIPVQFERWVTMPAQLQQKCQGNKGNQCQHCTGKDANATRVMTTAQQEKQCQCNDGRDASITIAMTPAQQGQQCQC